MIKWIEGILHKDGKVLIGKLRRPDGLIPRIQWTFPFVELKESESPRKAIKNLFEEEFGMKIDVGDCLLKYTPSENPKVEQYFYELKHVFGNVLVSKRYSNFSWIKPTQILKFFSTSVSKEIMDYLRLLERYGKGKII
jgi:hypothetical protein